MSIRSRESFLRARGLRAAAAVAAVTLAGCLDAKRGDVESGDTTGDASQEDAVGDAVVDTTASDTHTPPPDVADTADATPDALEVDAGPVCSGIPDNVCPPACTKDDDADCCNATNEFPDAIDCVWVPAWGCSCAVEGPLAPPELPEEALI